MSLIDAIPQNNPSTIEEWADGSFGAPSAKFAAEPTNGFYRPAADTLGVTSTFRATTSQTADKYAHEIDLGAPASGWTYSMGFFETGSVDDAEFGSIAHLVSGGTNLTALLSPGTLSDGGTGAGAIVIPPTGKIQLPAGLIVAREKHLGFSADAPVSAGTTKLDNAEVSAIVFDRTDATSDPMKWGLPDDSATISSELQIVAYANVDADYGQPIATTPTVKVFSDAAPGVATDEWLSFTHDGTDGVIASGTGVVDINANVEIGSATLGIFGTSAVAQQTINGTRLGNPALADLLTKLAAYGLIVDNTTL